MVGQRMPHGSLKNSVGITTSTTSEISRKTHMPLSTLCKKEALHSPVGARCVLGASDQLDTEHM
ncbi:hypothetical protein C8R48DRAFT_727591, partial [Suillus tomentosus]